MVLNKRIARDFKSNIARYIILFILIFSGMFLVVSMVAASDTITDNISEASKISAVEDGSWTVFSPLSDEEVTEIAEKSGIDIEESFYTDYEVEGSKEVRVFKVRNTINLLSLSKGTLPKDHYDICVEKKFAEANHLTIGSELNIAGRQCRVSGIGSTPDYESVLKNLSDTTSDHEAFGTVFVNSDLYEELKETGENLETETYQYAYKEGKKHEKTKEIKNRIEQTQVENVSMYGLDNNLLSFIKADNNPRIGETVNDISMTRMAGLIGGVIFLILFVYVISVYTIHSVEQESSMIGTLYALGVKKKTLMKHYITLPVLVTFFAGICGTLVGFTSFGIGRMMNALVSDYSLPEFETIHPVYLLIYGIIIPPLTSLIVNMFVLNGKLSEMPLELIRQNEKNPKVSRFKLKRLNFISAFRTRQFLREWRSSLAIVVGVFVACLMLMMGLYIQACLDKMEGLVQEDVKYEYSYALKYKNLDIAEGERVLTHNLLATSAVDGKTTFTTILMGISNDNPYFSFKPQAGKDILTISSSMATKFQLKEGDSIVLTDSMTEKKYRFKVGKVVRYSAGLFCFLPIEDIRELFDEEPDSYNMILSDTPLEIDSSVLYSTTTKDDYVNVINTFKKNQGGMVYSMIILSVIIFFTVLYLMMKIIIDRSTFSISMMSIFGYSEKLIRKLFLDGNLITYLFAMVISLPLNKMIMDLFWPQIIDHESIGMKVDFSIKYYLIAVIIMLISYVIVRFILIQKVKRNLVNGSALLLKNRE